MGLSPTCFIIVYVMDCKKIDTILNTLYCQNDFVELFRQCVKDKMQECEKSNWQEKKRVKTKDTEIEWFESKNNINTNWFWVDMPTDMVKELERYKKWKVPLFGKSGCKWCYDLESCSVNC